MVASILQDFERSGYLHVLLNPLPVYGLAVGLLALLIAICQRSRRATVSALVVVLICAAAAWPVATYGGRSFQGVAQLADGDGRAWLAEHARRASELVWLFYAVALLSLIALIVPAKWPKSSTPLAIAVLLLGSASLGAGGYIAYAGGRVRHREFRLEPPPKRPAKEAVSAAPAPSAAASAAATQITIELLKYSPQTVEVEKGGTVNWINNDPTPHTVTSKSGSELNSGSIESGSAWSHTFNQPGAFPYYCTFHTEMKATVIVR